MGNSVAQNPALSIQRIDARGLKCPLPVLRTRKVLNNLPADAQVEVLCTDPVSVLDIPNLVREMGFIILETSQTGEEYHFIIGHEGPQG